MMNVPKSPECLARRMASQLILGGAWIETIGLEVDGVWADLSTVNFELALIPRGLNTSFSETDYNAVVAYSEQVLTWAFREADMKITKMHFTGICAYEIAVSWLADGSHEITVQILDRLH